MDAKDFELLVALLEGARQSYRTLGRRVGLSHPAVRERVNDLERRGVLQGYFLALNPQIFGRDDLLVRFEGDWKREDAARALKVPDVAWIAWKLDGNLTVQLWPHDRTSALKELAHVLGANPSGQFLAEPFRRFRPPSLADWRIIDALIDDPKAPLRELTEKTGLSPKTVRSHLGSLLRERTIRIALRIGALADSGELVYTVSVFGEAGMDDLRKVIGDVYLIKQFQHPPAKHLLCRGSNLSEVLAKTRALGRLPGAARVLVSLNREQLIATENLHSLVSEQIRGLERVKSYDAG